MMELKQKRLNEMTEEEKTKNAEYSAFLDKFEPKLTTDDCYTPANVYNVISEYVASCYGLDCQNFVRPFYPGGDYVKIMSILIILPIVLLLTTRLFRFCRK